MIRSCRCWPTGCATAPAPAGRWAGAVHHHRHPARTPPARRRVRKTGASAVTARTGAWRLAGGALIVLAALTWTGCAKKKGPSLETRIGKVEVDRPVGTRGEFRTGEPDAWPSRTFPATYFAEILPEFPPQALEAGFTSVVVRVDFRIGRDGLAHDARAHVPEGTPLAEQFAAASEAVLPRWRFTPTWRLAAEGEEEPLVLMETSAFLAFRFDIEVWRDGGKVQVEFGH